MNPIEIFKLAGKLKWVGELVDAANKHVEPDKYKALLTEIITLGNELRQKIDALVGMIQEDAKELGFIATLPLEPSDSDIGIA